VVDRSVVPDPESPIEQHGNLYRRPMITTFTPDGHGVVRHRTHTHTGT
jgi:hypothetical protein